MSFKTLKKVILALIGIAAAVTSFCAVVAALLYKVAFDRIPPKLSKVIFGDDSDKPVDPIKEKRDAFEEDARELVEEGKTTEIYANSFDGLRLYSKLLWSEEETNKVAILVHGYHANPYGDLGGMIRYYHERGYHVLLPDDRAHRKSEGKYLGFGWLDRRDVITWSQQMVALLGDDIEIVLQGVSMGGATVMMASGESDLPKQVKAIIEDCGYSDSNDQFRHLFPNHLRNFAEPILWFADLYSVICNGYSLRKASSLKQLRRNTVPMLFIHGEADDFVPTDMVFSCYAACKGPKEIMTIPGAGHALAYAADPEVYENKVTEFLDKYIS